MSWRHPDECINDFIRPGTPQAAAIWIQVHRPAQHSQGSSPPTLSHPPLFLHVPLLTCCASFHDVLASSLHDGIPMGNCCNNSMSRAVLGSDHSSCIRCSRLDGHLRCTTEVGLVISSGQRAPICEVPKWGRERVTRQTQPVTLGDLLPLPCQSFLSSNLLGGVAM